ncbi:YceI family protein [Rheinheimera sp. WS51]|uniref:YceI family protein n=1 Tax=Rheinheimera sp. WS51 TaxID=3425886 RepID=UPI003D93B75C
MKSLLIFLAATSFFASATSWQLNPEQSSLNFISVKNSTVAEAHQFNNLSGTWSEQGTVNVTIPVTSLETHIPIRNQRVLDFVLKAKEYSQVTATADIKPAIIDSLTIGKSTKITVPLALNIAGETLTVMANIRVLKINATSIQATTESPVMLNVDAAKLTAGVDKLQELAKLNSISKMVPVTFSVNFQTQI